MVKKTRYIILISVILLISSIVYINSISVKKEKISEYVIPNNLHVIEVIDDKNMYVKDLDKNNICTYNVENKVLKDLNLCNSKSSIVNTKISDKWISWIESNDVEGDTGIIYVQKKEHGQKIMIEEVKDSNLNISLDGDNLVYCVREDDGIRIKLINLENMKKIVLDSVRKDETSFFSFPVISNNKVVWSRIDNSKKIKASIYLYLVDSDKTISLSSESNLLKPTIKDNMIMATRIEDNSKYTKSSIVKYNDQKKRWDIVIDDNKDIYKDLKDVSIDDPIISSEYIGWWDNYSKGLNLYNVKENEIETILPKKEKEHNQVYFIKKNMVFFRQFNFEKNEKLNKMIVIKK